MKKLTNEQVGFILKQAFKLQYIQGGRLGDKISLILERSHPELYNYISGTGADCKFRDDRIHNALEAISE